MNMLDLPSGGRRYLKIAHSLADQINAGKYQTGDRLPPERELSTLLAVSRTIVREALLALEIMRFVEIRVGSGVFVLPKSLRARDRKELIDDLEAGPTEVLDARRMVEGKAAYYAALYADTEIVDQLQTAVDTMQAAIDDIPRFDRADQSFHALVARASGNSLIESYVAHLWNFRHSSLWKTWYGKTRKRENRQRSIEDCRVILRAIRRREPAQAETAMQAHIDVLALRFFELNL